MNEPERSELTALVDRILARHCGLEYLRSQLDNKAAHSPDLWKRLADAGIVGVLAPEKFGGMGFAPGDVAGALEAMGRYVLPEPFLETAVIAVPTLTAFPSALSEHWLRRIVAGEAVVTVRMTEFGPYVPHAQDADMLLDIAPDGSVTVHNAATSRFDDAGSIDPLRPLTKVTPTEAGITLGTDRSVADRARRLALGGSACLLSGVGRGLVETTVEYVTIRHQFGRPVGSFQAVKHKAATMAIGVSMAHSAALSALDAIDMPNSMRAATAAKAYASQAADVANVESLQLHGGIGFTWEHHLHAWMKRAMSLGASYGTARELRQWLARDLLSQLGSSVRA